MKFEFTNLDVVLNELDKKISDEALKKSVGKACAIVEREAKTKAPKDTGELRRSIQSTIKKEDGQIVGTVFSDAEYAPYVEFGTGLFAEEGDGRKKPWSYQDDKGKWHTTSGMKPHPFLRPAFAENREKIKQKIMEGIIDD